EQVEGRDVGPETDVYSLGLVLIEAFTGRRVFPGGVMESALARLDRDPVVPPEMPAQLARVVRAMTARSPERRPKAFDAMVAFREFVVSELGARRPSEQDEETQRLAAVRRYDLIDTPPDGANLGWLAIIDFKPHRMNATAIATLEDLAAMVQHEMELRLAARRVVLGRS